MAVIILIGTSALCGYFGYYLAKDVLKENPYLYTTILTLVGIIIGFFFDTLIFGLIGQITEIRRNLELLNSKK